MAKTAAPPPEFDLSTLGTIGGPKSTGPRSKTEELDTAGLEDYMALAEVGRQIEALLKGQIGDRVRAQILTRFITDGTAIGRCPANYSGIEADCKASLQLRIKDNRTKLSPEQVAMFNELGLGAAVTTFTKKYFTLAVAPKYAHDKEKIQKMIAVLQAAGFTIGGPDSFIEIQEEDSHQIVAERALDHIFAKAKTAAAAKKNSFGSDKVRELLAIVATALVGTNKWPRELTAAIEVATRKLSPSADDRAKTTAAVKDTLRAALDESLAAETNPDARLAAVKDAVAKKLQTGRRQRA